MTYPTYITEEGSQGFPVLGTVSTWFGVIIVGLTAVGASLSSPLEPAKTKPLVDLLQFILIALILASIMYLFVRAGEGVKVTAVPLVINMGTLVILRLVPFGPVWEEVRFQYHWADYQTIVQKVESGEWQPDGSGTFLLPAHYQNLSVDNGRIWVEQQDNHMAVFFVTEQNGPGQFAGYLYRSDGRPPQGSGLLGQWQYVLPKGNKWFFCVSG